MKELHAILERLNRPGASARAVLATLVAVEGSSYRQPGARLLIAKGSDRLGSISGGCLEEDVCARAAEVVRTRQAETVVYDTTSENELLWGVGLGCHGVVHVLLEPLDGRPSWAPVLASNLAARRETELAVVWRSDELGRLGTFLAADLPKLPPDAAVFRQTIAPPTRLIVFGAGDDAKPLVRVAKELGWHVTVADPRPAVATAARFPSADAVVTGPADELAGRAAPEPDACAVVMTHHYVHDAPLAKALLARPLAYLGLLGPKKRAERILLDAVNGSPAERTRVHAPAGLDLGAETPEEVALSIVAEIQAVLAGRNGRPLRERRGPIHDRR